MSLVKTEANRKLIKASASFGRSKSVVINFFGGYTYIHLYNQSSRLSLGWDEYKQLIELADSEKVEELDQQFIKQVMSYNKY